MHRPQANVTPTPQAYWAFQQRVRDQGVAVARGPVAASPLHLILHELAAMDQFFYLYKDAPEAMRQLGRRMEPFLRPCLKPWQPAMRKLSVGG